jgi:hypothetical protein
MQPADKTAPPPNTTATRVFTMLSAITGMYFKAGEPNEPFGPMVTFADGRRSAIPSDFREGHVDLLAEMAKRAKHPVLAGSARRRLLVAGPEERDSRQPRR